jgi:hypothetical protein
MVETNLGDSAAMISAVEGLVQQMKAATGERVA